MAQKKRVRLLPAAACAVLVLLLALFLWKGSPGPAWLAEHTARQYTRQYAPEYTELELIQGVHEQAVFPGVLGGLVTVKSPSWVVACREEPDSAAILRLELNNGLLPLWVTDAGTLDMAG